MGLFAPGEKEKYSAKQNSQQKLCPRKARKTRKNATALCGKQTLKWGTPD